MKTNQTFLVAVVTIAAAAVSAPATAASLDLVGATPVVGGLPSNFSLDDGVNPTYDALTSFGMMTFGEEGDAISAIGSDVKSDMNGLRVSGLARVTYTYLGSEAGNENEALEISGTDIVLFNNKSGSNVGDVSATFTVGAGFLPFAFTTTNGRRIANDGFATTNGANADNGLNVAYSAVFNDGKSVLAFFGDNDGDSDRDDLGLRIDVAAVPLPAAAWLLMGGLAGLGALGRKRRAA